MANNRALEAESGWSWDCDFVGHLLLKKPRSGSLNWSQIELVSFKFGQAES